MTTHTNPEDIKRDSGDLVSRKWLTDAIRNRRTYLSYEDAKDVIDLINHAPTVDTYTKDDMTREYLKGYNACKDMNERPQSDIRWTDKLSVKSNGDVIDFEGRVVGRIDLNIMKGEQK